MSEREEAEIKERDSKIMFMFSGFTFSIGAHSISKEVAEFSPLWFPRGKFFMSLVSCVFIAVHVILSVKDPKIIMLA